ncbi:hypothetical protein BH10PSE1_BH10PSE1_01750 [soil metagenome]
MAPIVGPMQICFKYSSFKLLEGERIVGFQGGMEAMAIDLEGPSGAFRIGESEIFSGPRHQDRRVAQHDDTSVYRVSQPRLRYAIYGKTDFSDGRDRLVIWLDGNALDGSRRDARIYDRLIVGDTTALSCRHTYTYGWDF